MGVVFVLKQSEGHVYLCIRGLCAVVVEIGLRLERQNQRARHGSFARGSVSSFPSQSVLSPLPSGS